MTNSYASKTVGIVGGIAPESTIQYYRQIVNAYQAFTNDSEFPPVIINSIHMTKMLDLIGAKKIPEVTAYLLQEIKKLHSAGANFAVLASNTPHIVFDELQRQSPIPLISIVETACIEAKSQGLKRLGILGTKFTMQGTVYPSVFAAAGIEVVSPHTDEQDTIHTIYMGELVKGILRPASLDQHLQIIEMMKRRDHLDGVILGGTELPLILTQPSHDGLPLLDTTKLHVARIVKELF